MTGINNLSNALPHGQGVFQNFSTPARRFAAVFLFSLCFFFLLLNLAPESFFSVINVWNARAAAQLLELFSIPVKVQGALILSDRFSVNVIGECSAIFISVLPVSFSLACPAPLLKKCTGILAGLFFLFSINLFRITLLFMVGLKLPAYFRWIHLYLSQTAMILIVIWICMAFSGWIQPPKNKDRSAKILCASFIFSFFFFAAWIWLGRPYTWLILNLAKYGLHLAGLKIILPETIKIYPHIFISFNIVIFMSLILAFSINSAKLSIGKVLTGTLLLFLLHTGFQVLPFLFFQHHWKPGALLINAFLILHQFIFPFCLWMFLHFKPDGSAGASVP